MTLIKSISGIRGTIGGQPGEGLTPVDMVNFSSAFALFLKQKHSKERIKIVMGRDARISGPLVEQIVANTLVAMGTEVVSLGLATTPTVEIAVPHESADGGIIITASHNPGEWNALKLLNEKGEFISAEDGAMLISLVEKQEFEYVDVKMLGKIRAETGYGKKHIESILGLKLVDVRAISEANLSVITDCVNSVGGIIIPDLLHALGVKKIISLYSEPSGNFPHNPEPLPENLGEISERIVQEGADVGFVVDPDVDRLAIVCEDGSMFGEEYTLVAVSDYVLSQTPGNTCSNLSSSRALRDITESYNRKYSSAPVGEVNVVEKMKETDCVIGGEGNGGIIYPALHYGRDALAGIALFLTHLAKSKLTCSDLRKKYPIYVISKNKISLSSGIDIDFILSNLKKEFSSAQINESDGLKIDLPEGWVHLRKSNTEPIIRIYAEHRSVEQADELARQIMNMISDLTN